jgi:predicted metal-dependent hydrolase
MVLHTLLMHFIIQKLKRRMIKIDDPLLTFTLHLTRVQIFFWCKSGILRAQLQRLIFRALWDLNERQAFPKSFNAATCSKLNSNHDLRP